MRLNYTVDYTINAQDSLTIKKPVLLTKLLTFDIDYFTKR